MKTIQPITVTSEVAIIYKRPLYKKMPVIKSSDEANTIIREFVDLSMIDYKEFFWVILLNRSNRVLGISEIGKGDTSGVIVNIKEIFQLALIANATNLILCHNHPSGNLNYSKPDIEMTNKIYDIGKLFNIQLFDHIIITSEGYFSFADESLIENLKNNTIPF